MKRSGKFQVFLISKGGVKMTEKKKEKEHEKKKPLEFENTPFRLNERRSDGGSAAHLARSNI